MKQQKKQEGITVFYSYAEADRAWRDQLAVHLSQLKRDGLIEEWSDQQILAGSNRTQEIDQAIHSAHIILLLISADFLASDTCYQIEMQQALERHKRGEARVVPIIVRPCDWESSLFAHLQWLPRNSRPITSWHDQEEAFATIAKDLRQIVERQRFPSLALSSIQRQNRDRLLKRVRAIWIKGLLEVSLHQAGWINLLLQEQPDALENPWRFQVQELDHTPRVLPAGTSIVEIYDEADGELLILGEPGAGKTTLLLHLARTLLDRAEADERLPMPVIFNLSSWAQKQEPLTTWLVEELKTKYQVPRQVGQYWIEANQILPLLDGLDEVAAEARFACVQTLTAYHQNQRDQATSSLVLCCRSHEYQEIAVRLHLNQAISILPLTNLQVDTYLSLVGRQADGLHYLLTTEPEFAALVHTPLMLNIATLAFRGKRMINFPSSDNFPSPDNFPANPSREQLYQIVFHTYVEQMLNRREKLQSWKPEQILHWLHFLAKQLHRRHQTVFSVEDLQPDWLPRKQQRLYQSSFGLALGLILGLLVSQTFGLLVSQIFGLVVGLVSWLLVARVVSSVGGLPFVQGRGMIQPAEVISWSWEKIRSRLLRRLTLFAIFIVIFVALLDLLQDAPLVALLDLLFGLFVALLFGLSKNQLTERTHLSPNEGIRRSLKNGLFVGLFIGLFVALLGSLLPFEPFFSLLGNLLPFRSSFGLLVALLFGLFVALLFGLLAALPFGLYAFMQHFVLRFWLRRTGCLPWGLVPFLDKATERLLLRKVGGSYIFIHRLLLEYFVALDEPKPSESTSSEDKAGKHIPDV